MKAPTLQFTHAGVTRTLAKHPALQLKFKLGQIGASEINASSWYLRTTIDGKARSFRLNPTAKDEAIRAAKDLLNAQTQRPHDFAAFLADRDARQGVTIGTLAAEWLKAGCPFDQTDARSEKAAREQKNTLARALPWWKDKSVSTITPGMHAEYVLWRRAHNRFTLAHAGAIASASPATSTQGTRSADKELACLSCLCQWALACEKITANPFGTRKTYMRKEDISHCHEAMPDDDQQLHAILDWFFTPGKKDRRDDPDQIVIAGAALAFCALTGLRPGEPGYLYSVPRATSFPANLRQAPDGLIYPTPDGNLQMKVKRTKHGQNPAVILRPAVQDFLTHYTPWLAGRSIANLEATPRLFPVTEDYMRTCLARACRDLKIKDLKAHGMRAYYVRVRRGQGLDDAAIAVELGQTSKGDLIRSVYGDPLDPVGGNLHDWLPAGRSAAWQQLNSPSENKILNLNQI